MQARNPITGDRIRTGANSEEFRSNWDLIFKKEPNEPDAARDVIQQGSDIPSGDVPAAPYRRPAQP